MRSHHTSARRLLATACAGALLLSCSSDPDDQLEASVETPEPAVEPSPSGEPTDEPSASESPEPEASEAEAPPLGEDERLFAPLPELTPDPDNDVPDDLEQIILDAYADAYEVEFAMYTTGQFSEDELNRTHFGEALEGAIDTHAQLQSDGAVELSADTTIDRVWIKDEQGGAAIVRECYTTGPATGVYDAESLEPIRLVSSDVYARDMMLELVQVDNEEEPRFRLTRVEQAGSEQC